MRGAEKHDDFNPHSHAGSDARSNRGDYEVVISIHTPTQGVTEQMESVGKQDYISIHTPTQGVTL